jgi:signal transduction histidine kinase
MPKIIVIEDEFEIRDEVMSWLDFEGYETAGAENGKLGLDLIYREQPDLVLCDISMPEMDGHEVLMELRSNVTFAHVPFVFLTASVDRESMRKSMNLGADDYLTKPFSQPEIINAVRTRLGKQDRIQSQISHLSNLVDAEREQRLLKSRLVGMFSHDFRNPLATILGSSNILQTYMDRLTPERRQQHFHRIDGAVHLLLQMLDEMLMVAEIENGQLVNHPQPTDLKKLIENIVADFHLIDGDRHPIYTDFHLPAPVLIDPKLVQHVITNVISNAIKYSPEGSEVKIQASFEQDQVTISVQDAGIGIPESDIESVFEPFFRAKNAHIAKGTGLGLALVKQTVDLCGGTITIASEIGRGTLLTVMIPASRA